MLIFLAKKFLPPYDSDELKRISEKLFVYMTNSPEYSESFLVGFFYLLSREAHHLQHDPHPHAPVPLLQRVIRRGLMNGNWEMRDGQEWDSLKGNNSKTSVDTQTLIRVTLQRPKKIR
jgi:hypothetical protein